MGFSEAIASVFKNYANFKGRARRKEYWYFVIFNMIASGLLTGISTASESTFFMVLQSLYTLAVAIPSLAVIWRRLHDIGKSIDHEVEGSHVQLGADIARKYKENPVVVNAIESHHGDVEPKTVIAVLVQAADAVSAARPGARRENVENYIRRLQKLEELTGSYPGVDKAFAIQAGREVRIMVKPEVVSEDNMVLLARDVAKKIESELEYPGQIKVNVIRETKAVEYAK